MFSFYHKSEVKDQEKFDHLNEVFNLRSNALIKEEAECKKVEDKANLLTAGYMKRFHTLNETFNTYSKEIEELKRMKSVYEILYTQERSSIVKRKNDLENEINIFKEKERSLQRKYRRYKDKLAKLEKEWGDNDIKNNGDLIKGQ